MSKVPRHSSKNKSINYTSQDIDEALLPFEQALVAHFPSKEQIILRARQRKQRQKLGTSALILVASSSLILFWWNPAYQTQQWTTQLGETRKINFSDGSQVHLNTDSKVLVKMHLRSREIQLQQGEATFHVGHLPDGLRKLERPFTVQAGQLHIEDIGTVFNVRRYSQQYAVVTVLQGKVRVSTQATPTHYIDLEQNQSIENHATLLGEIKYVNAQEQTVWRDGVIKFDHMPLGDVIREFQRYAAFQVYFNQPQAAQLKISGSFDAVQSQQFLELLPNFAPVQVQQLPSGTWQISARKNK